MFFCLLLAAGALAIKEPVVLDLVANPPKEGETITRLIKVDYTFETESLIYDDIKNKINTPSVIFGGNFSFDTLHYDTAGNILARFQMTACRGDPCDLSWPAVFISFVQGGNNINGVYIDSKDGTVFPSWNFLYGIINTIYTPALNGEGDEQIVDTVYGRCRVHFGRPENKKFRRIIDNCEVGQKEENYTRFDYQDYVHYNQDALYTQNTKVDADIIIIDAVELLSIRTPFDDRWGFQLESRSHVEITNRSQYYVEKLCDEELAEECATKILGLTKVGDKLYEGVKKGLRVDSQFSRLLMKYREHLFDMGESHTCTHHSSLYAELFEAAKKASPGEWGRAIQAPENEPVLSAIGNLLGTIGSTNSLLVAREVLFQQGDEFLDDFLFGAAHATKTDEKFHKQLLYWLAETEQGSETYWKIANSMATVLRRRCERTTSSLNACQKGKDRLVEKFFEEVRKCESLSCRAKALEVLQNLPLPQSFEFARGFLCGQHPPELQSTALRLISSSPAQFYDSQLVQVLVRLFRDTCPKKTSTLDSHLAVNILSKCVPDLQHAATLILRSETNFPDDHERWQYFYSRIKASGDKEELKEDFWKKMRAFKVFRPNYLQRSLVADSFAHWQSLSEIADFDLHQEVASYSDHGQYRGSDLSLFAKKGKKTYSLFEMNLWSLGGIPGIVDSADHTAGTRWSFFDHSLPVQQLFSNKGTMLDKVWEADGQTLKNFHGNVILRSSEATVPLLSGASVDFYSRGAATASLFSSVGVSLERKDISTSVTANVSLALTAEGTLVFGEKAQRTVGSELSAVTSFGALGEALAVEGNTEICQAVHRNDIQLSLETSQTGEKHHLRRKTVPGKTFRLHEVATRQCNDHLKTFLFLTRVPPVDL